MSRWQLTENKTAKNRVHLDLVATEVDEEVARLVALGARVGEEHSEGGVRWTTLTDPEGNEFDVVAA
ncbi:MAG TPA: VOC family protein [Pseudonocardiaceae bacterium]|nr:VOC family protein [Pseudonocardiaceae bacterium]